MRWIIETEIADPMRSMSPDRPFDPLGGRNVGSERGASDSPDVSTAD